MPVSGQGSESTYVVACPTSNDQRRKLTDLDAGKRPPELELKLSSGAGASVRRKHLCVATVSRSAAPGLFELRFVKATSN